MVESGHNTKTIAGKEYWTTGHAAEYLGISKVALLKYVKSEKLSHMRIGTTVYYTQEWLDDYIEECTKIGVANRKGGKKCK